QAAEQARRQLDRLDWQAEQNPASLGSGHFPVRFDAFRVESERAGWENAGRPAQEALARRELVRSRLLTLLAELTGNAGRAAEAARARPDLPAARALLGRLLLGAGRAAEAAGHLRRALDGNPFDLHAARDLAAALDRAGHGAARERLIDER